MFSFLGRLAEWGWVRHGLKRRTEGKWSCPFSLMLLLTARQHTLNMLPMDYEYRFNAPDYNT